MGSRSAAAALGLLALASFCCSIPLARGEAVDGGTGRGGGDGGDAAEGARGARLLLSFHEAKGNASFRCSPVGPCLPCQYSEKVGAPRFLPPILSPPPPSSRSFLRCLENEEIGCACFFF